MIDGKHLVFEVVWIMRGTNVCFVIAVGSFGCQPMSWSIIYANSMVSAAMQLAMASSDRTA